MCSISGFAWHSPLPRKLYGHVPVTLRAITFDVGRIRQAMDLHRQDIPLRHDDGWQLLQANGAPVDSHIIHELLKIAFQQFGRQRLSIFRFKSKDLVGTGPRNALTHGAVVAVVDDLQREGILGRQIGMHEPTRGVDRQILDGPENRHVGAITTLRPRQ